MIVMVEFTIAADVPPTDIEESVERLIIMGSVNLRFDGTFLRFGGAPNLYCNQRVIVEPAVTAAELDHYLVALRCTDLILAPLSLRDALAPKCTCERIRCCSTTTPCGSNRGASELTVERFTALDAVATLFVDGELTIHAEVEPTVLANTPVQKSALQIPLGRSDGGWQESTKPEEGEEQPRRIGNIGYLTLWSSRG